MNILHQAEQYVRELLTEKLPANRTFHDVSHTESVVDAAGILCREMNVIKSEKEMVLLAAWFHDTGHVLTFKGHESESQQFSSEFLKAQNYPQPKIEQILQIIGATQMHTSPSNFLEEIICDADFYHLSVPGYHAIQEKLRMELHLVLGKSYRDNEWKKLNIQFLKEHKYLTEYGRNVLAKRKEKNIRMCESATSD